MYSQKTTPKRESSSRRPFTRSSRPARDGAQKPSFSRNRFSRGASSRPKKRGYGVERIDVSKFVRKAEQVTHEIYVPVHTFNDFTIHDSLKKSIAERGYVTPSPIQDQAIPHALQGTDIIGLANTGTGKTAAFLIPVIDALLRDKSQITLIMAPTRELAVQIEKECFSLTKGLGIYSTVCVGGAPIYPQIKKLERRPHIIIGTPGRLKDLFERNKLALNKMKKIVLDEADRMLDMGFIDDIRHVLSHMPTERHMLLFSATLAPQIETLIHDFLKNPIKISVKTRDTSKNVDQDIVRIGDKKNKFPKLLEILNQKEVTKTLVFVETKRFADEIERLLQQENVTAVAIHGDKQHRQRVRALQQFEQGQAQVLIATDVAARGLDISSVSHVINYDIPQNYDTYVHRIGRTGRGDKTGIALTFV
jgi:ATP-dependent RNA helicase RhlE